MLFIVFSCCFQQFISVFNFCQFDYCVSQCVPPGVYPSWDSLWFLNLVDYLLSRVWEVFSSHLFKYFLRSFLSLFSFWDPYNGNVGAFNVVEEVSQAVFISFLFSVFCSVAVISTILSSMSFMCSSASVFPLLISFQCVTHLCSSVLLGLC